MSSNELFGIAAHMHVLLRRKTGRVTDTEWMVVNAEYAREVVRYAREKAVTDGHADLLPMADKLEAAIARMAPVPRKTLLEVAADTLRAEFQRLLGARDPAGVVHQCGSGVSAVPNLLAMELAGLGRAALYPGSWSAWCNTEGMACARG